MKRAYCSARFSAHLLTLMFNNKNLQEFEVFRA